MRAAPAAAFMDRNRQTKIAATLPGIREVVAQIVAADNLVGDRKSVV